MVTQESVQANSPKTDIAARITAKIIALLENKVVPWRCTWAQKVVTNRPRSAGSGQPYQGINALHLSAVMWREGYSSPTFITFQEAKKRGGTVRRGEHGYPVVYWKILEVEDKAARQTDVAKKHIPMLRYSTVFNAAQCEGLQIVEADMTSPFVPIGSAETIWRNMPHAPRLVSEEQKAWYSPGRDVINMPLPETFDASADYYVTLFHEAIHSTAHPTRLGRELGARFGSDPYAREELVAEMGAAMLCAYAGIEDATIENSASYLDNWIRVLKGDKRLLITAAGQAERAVAFIRHEHAEQQPDNWQDNA